MNNKFRLIQQEKIKGWHVMSAYEPEADGYTWTAWAKETPFVHSPPSAEEGANFYFGDSRADAVDGIMGFL